MATDSFNAPGIPRAQARRSRQLLLACVLGSLMLHVAALVVLPEPRPDAKPLAVRALDVALVTVEPPQPLPPTPPEDRRALAPPARKSPAPVPRREETSRPQPPDQMPLALPEPAPAGRPALTVPAPALEPPPAGAVTRPPAATVPSRDSASPVTPPVFRAEYLRNPAPRYPLVARRNGEQGTVTLRVLVTREGVPAQVSVEKSSGSAHLDGAALDAVKTWRFVPARRGAEAVEAWVLVPVVFRLEGVS